GLLLLLIEQPHIFVQQSPPHWVEIWLTNQYKKRHRKMLTPAAQDERDNKRQEAILLGLQELEIWLHDLVRNGFAVVQGKPKSFWFQMANRLIDAQAGGLAHEIRQMANIPDKGTEWPEILLKKVGRLHLLIQGFYHFETLPADVQADLRMAVGWLPKAETSETVLSIRDHWHVLGRHVDQENKQKIQRIWLWGERTNRASLLINLVHRKQMIDTSLIIGTAIDADLSFSLSTTPLLAHVVKQFDTLQPTQPVTGFQSIKTATTAYAQTITHNPWLPRFPMVLSSLIAMKEDGHWIVQDQEGSRLPLPDKYLYGWHLNALNLQRIPALFGNWNGTVFTPTALWQQDRWLSLNILGGVR
ncbi:MAG: SWIM zinc finger family protein, partial [Chloroflexota bacterium]